MALGTLQDRQLKSHIESPSRDDGTALEVVESSTGLITRLDQATSKIAYVGAAKPSSLTSEAVWQIKKIDETVGIVITFADGNSNFDNIWNDRASLTYT